MAWTWKTAAFFALHPPLSWPGYHLGKLRSPGGAPRVGILAIETTRGDRLFIALLGLPPVLRHLGWLGLLGTPLWGATVVSLLFAAAIFRWV